MKADASDLSEQADNIPFGVDVHLLGGGLDRYDVLNMKQKAF